MKISLAPSLERFVADKLKSGDYEDSSEVIRDSLRRWKEQEKASREQMWLEGQIQEGLDSVDLRGGKAFWKDLRAELHQEHKNGSQGQ